MKNKPKQISVTHLLNKLKQLERKVTGELTYYESWKNRIGEKKALAIRKKRNSKNRMHDTVSYLYSEAKSRAKRNNMKFSISKSDIIIPKKCPVLGIPIKRNSGKNGPWDYSPTIDRMDNKKGYTKDNICVISWKANKLKNNASLKEMEAVVKYMRKVERNKSKRRKTKE